MYRQSIFSQMNHNLQFPTILPDILELPLLLRLLFDLATERAGDEDLFCVDNGIGLAVPLTSFRIQSIHTRPHIRNLFLEQYQVVNKLLTARPVWRPGFNFLCTTIAACVSRWSFWCDGGGGSMTCHSQPIQITAGSSRGWWWWWCFGGWRGWCEEHRTGMQT